MDRTSPERTSPERTSPERTSSELGGILAELRGLCSSKRKWTEFLREHLELESMIRRWRKWVKLLDPWKQYRYHMLNSETTTTWHYTIPVLPFSEDELNYLTSPLLDDLATVQNMRLDEAFCQLCQKSTLETLQWFYTATNMTFFPYGAMLDACEYGNVKALKWGKDKGLDYELTSVKLQMLFNKACQGEQLDVLDWLVQNYPYRERLTLYFFHDVCLEGKTRVAQWMSQRFPHIARYEWLWMVFRQVCEIGHLETAKWFVEAFPFIDIDDARAVMTLEIRNHFFPN